MKPDKSMLSGATPLLVLSLLKDGDKYGYEMIEELASRSDDTFLLKEGTLYPILHTLEKEKCLTAYRREASTGRERKYYHITKKGLQMLEEKQQEWELFSGRVNDVLSGGSHALA